MNVFGRLYVDWFSPGRLGQVRATAREQRADGSLFLQFGEEPADAESEEMSEMQAAAKRILGEDAFFDIARPHRSLNVPTFGS